MKYVKILGLAIAATVLIAFAGVGSASATVLCKTAPENEGKDCAPSWGYMSGETFEASSATSVLFEDTSGNSIGTCTSGGGLKGKTTNTGSASETVDGFMEELKFSGCTVTVGVPAFGAFEIHATDNDESTVTLKSFEITLSTTLTGSCFYGSKGGIPLGSMKGGEQPTLPVNAGISKVSGGLACPASIRWTATYTVTSPRGMHFATTLS